MVIPRMAATTATPTPPLSSTAPPVWPAPTPVLVGFKSPTVPLDGPLPSVLVLVTVVMGCVMLPAVGTSTVLLDVSIEVVVVTTGAEFELAEGDGDADGEAEGEGVLEAAPEEEPEDAGGEDVTVTIGTGP
ncbi:hypothetical protein BD414DRAFT_582012 [Trametes punicea]|nr:hypothetical protein BD414DRAFT_582012 [Trametes punicea]